MFENPKIVPNTALTFLQRNSDLNVELAVLYVTLQALGLIMPYLGVMCVCEDEIAIPENHERLIIPPGCSVGAAVGSIAALVIVTSPSTVAVIVVRVVLLTSTSTSSMTSII